MKILAVDDDENILELLSEAVTVSSEHTLTMSASGPEAIRAISKAKVPFDCFLLDVQMPVMDGIALAQKIRKMKPYARTPILMLTAMSQKKHVDAAFAVGATDYITKPFDFLELFTRIKIAERLVDEQQRLARRAKEMAALKKELLQNTSHSLAEPIEIIGVTQMVGYVAFENHLLRLSRAQLMRGRAFAVKINTIESAYRALSAVSFRQMVTDIGSELMSVVAENDAVATYRGSGIFLCRLPSNSGFSAARMEAELNARLEYLPSTQIDGLQNDVSFGDSYGLRALTRAGALQAVQNAVSSAEARSRGEFHGGHKTGAAANADTADGFANEMERRAYENLLQEALREEEHNRPIASFG